jgi:hypothetical protein
VAQIRRPLTTFFALGLILVLLAPMVCAQSTDRSELDQFLKETANQGPPPPAGTKITEFKWHNL